MLLLGMRRSEKLVRRENPMELRGTKRGSDHIEPFSRRAAKHQSVCPYQFVCLPIRFSLFDYRYGTRHTIKGKQGDEIILTPRQKGDIQSIVLFISDNYQPLYITIRLSNGQTQEFRILSYKTRQAYTDDTFRFNPKHYPDAEVIDMR